MLARIDVPVLVREYVDLERLAALLDVDAVVARVDLDAVVDRVDIDAVVDRVDIDAILDRVDLDAVAARLDLDRMVAKVDVAGVIDRVDLDAVVARVDLDRAVERVDLDAVVDRVDLDHAVDRVDVDRVIARMDLAGLARYVVGEIDLPGLLRASTGSVTDEMVRSVRDQGADADRAVERMVDRLLHRQARRTATTADTDPDRPGSAGWTTGGRAPIPDSAYPWHDAPSPETVAAGPRASSRGTRAGLITRSLANIADVVVVVLLVVGGYVAVAATRFLLGPTTFRFPAPSLAILLLVGLCLQAVYFAVTWAVVGGTYGDRLLGLRVADDRGAAWAGRGASRGPSCARSSRSGCSGCWSAARTARCRTCCCAPPSSTTDESFIRPSGTMPPAPRRVDAAFGCDRGRLAMTTITPPRNDFTTLDRLIAGALEDLRSARAAATVPAAARTSTGDCAPRSTWTRCSVCRHVASRR